MMMKLLLFKEKLKEFYAKYDIYINPVIKFLLAFLSLWMLRTNLGYMTRFNSLAVILVVSLLCSLLPVGAVVLFSAIFMLGHIYALSLEAFLVCLILFGIMFFAYYVFKPGDSIILVLVPLLFWLRMPYLVPFILGLSATALSAVPAGFGTIIYYMITAVKQNAAALTETETSSMLTRFQLMVDQTVANRAAWIMIMAFAVTIVLVYIIRRLSVPHSWKIAVGVGAIAEIAIILAGMMILRVSRTNFPVVSMVIGIVVSVLLSLVLEFFLFSVDYNRTEYVQFEDDDYYYYVKAVPKLTVTPPQREVKRFAVNSKGREQGLSETVDLGEDVRELMNETDEK